MKIIGNSSISSVLLLLWLSPVSGQILTNEQVVATAAREGVENSFQSLNSGFISIDVIDDVISRPVEIGLTEGFENLGINVVGNDSAYENVQNVECDVLGFDFKYGNGKSRGFLRRRMIKRQFKAVLKMTFSSKKDKSISRITDITLNYEDQINPEQVEFAKSRKIPALDPPFPSSGFKRVAEPVIVTAAVGALIYLFFANR